MGKARSSSRPSAADLEKGNVPWVCWCLRLVPKAEAGKTALKTCPKETGRLNRHCLPQPLSGRFQFWATPQPIRFPSCFSTPSRRIRKENIGSWETRHTSSLGAPPGPRPRSPIPSPALDATSGCGVAQPGVGLQHPPGPAILKSRASAACDSTFAHGHALSAEGAPCDPLLSSGSSFATLLNCSRPFYHSQL